MEASRTQKIAEVFGQQWDSTSLLNQAEALYQVYMIIRQQVETAFAESLEGKDLERVTATLDKSWLHDYRYPDEPFDVTRSVQMEAAERKPVRQPTRRSSEMAPVRSESRGATSGPAREKRAVQAPEISPAGIFVYIGPVSHPSDEVMLDFALRRDSTENFWKIFLYYL